MKKKILLIGLILFIVFLVGLLFIIYKNNDTIVLRKNEFVFELGEDISADVSYYLKNADATKNIKEYKLVLKDLSVKDGKILNNDLENLTIGNYVIKIQYKNCVEEFLIEVVDTTSPKFIEFKEKIELEETKETVDLISFFKTDDYSEVQIKIVGDYDLTKHGDYKVSVVAVDSSNNITQKECIILVKEKEKTVVSKPNSAKNESSSNNSNNDTTSNKNESSTNKTDITVQPSPRYRKDISDVYIAKINAYRKENGLSELPVTVEAQNEADKRAKEISSYYSHDGAGYGFGENIGEGSVGVDFFVAWKNSPSHNAAMLREQIVAMAASVYEINNHWYAVVSFRMNY